MWKWFGKVRLLVQHLQSSFHSMTLDTKYIYIYIYKSICISKTGEHNVSKLRDASFSWKTESNSFARQGFILKKRYSCMPGQECILKISLSASNDDSASSQNSIPLLSKMSVPPWALDSVPWKQKKMSQRKRHKRHYKRKCYKTALHNWILIFSDYRGLPHIPGMLYLQLCQLLQMPALLQIKTLLPSRRQ